MSTETTVVNKGQSTQAETETQVTGTELRLIDYIPIHITQLDNAAPDRHHRRFLDFPASLVRKINWRVVLIQSKKWVTDPANSGLIAWLIAVGAGLLLLFLLVSGILNKPIPDSSVRKKWEETINQILNALFTIMCMYQHPRLLHHLFLLLRWAPKDAAELRSVYCRYVAPRNGERWHLTLVVALLHITCLSQYALCGLYWGYTADSRPDGGESTCIAVGIAAPVLAAAYTLVGPLGRDPHESAGPEQADVEAAAKDWPDWAGGVLDFETNLPVSCLSLWCTCCVFGWNAERMGFGNRYVHVATFALLFVAPLAVFLVAGIKVEDEEVRYVVAGSGVVLCCFGFLYGGFWRVKMRRTYGLPGNGLCWGYMWVVDCAVWMFCWWCALAQEVRTVDLYTTLRRKAGESGAGGLGRCWSDGAVRVGEDRRVMRTLSCPPKLEVKTVGLSGSGAAEKEEAVEMTAPQPVEMEMQKLVG